MGQKASKDSLYLTLEEFYPSPGTYKSSFLAASSAGTVSAEPASLSGNQCPVSKSTCEFSDFCNHMYYIEDRCHCATMWKRMPGLVLLASA